MDSLERASAAKDRMLDDKSILTSSSETSMPGGTMKFKSRKFYRASGVILIVFALASLLIYGCDCTQPQTGSVSGKVTLSNESGNPENDPVDFAGVTIALYEPAQLDSTIARINGEHPQIGVIISQETEFDHRESAQVAQTISAADGSYSLPEVEPGTYNLVFLKDGWGFSYQYGIQVVAGEDNSDNDSVLYATAAIPATVLEPFTFASDRVYFITESTNFIQGVTLMPRATICIAAGAAVRFHGAVTTPAATSFNEAWKFVAARDIYSVTANKVAPEDYFGSLMFYQNGLEISNGIISQINAGVSFQSSFSTISNLLIIDCGSGLIFPQGNADINHVVIANSYDDSSAGIDIQSGTSASSEIRNCIIAYMYDGITLNTLCTYTIDNCYLQGNWHALMARYSGGDITHNAFNANAFDFLQYYVDTPTYVSFNNFFHSTQLTAKPWRVATLNNNNLYGTGGIFISIWDQALYNNTTVGQNIDATNNYWAVANIDAYILDAADNPQHPGEECPYYVIYNPKRSSPVPTAGIQ